MTDLPFCAPPVHCQSAPACGHPPCFLARFEGSAGQRPVVRAVADGSKLALTALETAVRGGSIRERWHFVLTSCAV